MTFLASIDLSSLDGTNGFVLNGSAIDDNSGFSVSSAGDVNGDGIDDLIIGAPYADPTSEQTKAGASYVVFGMATVPAGPSDGDDDLTGTEGDDTINLLAGNDRYDSLGGNDTVRGAEGNDTLFGGDGNDKLFGEDGNDILDGGSGDDTLGGLNGNNTLTGGSGNDTYIVSGSTSVITELAVEGIDRVRSSADYTLGDNLEELVLISSARNGTGNSENNRLVGNGNNNFLSGLAGDDTLVGRSGSDNLNGDDGNDTLRGGADNDLLFGGEGDDMLNGGEGNDTLNGGNGRDTLIGGSGQDTFVIGDRLLIQPWPSSEQSDLAGEEPGVNDFGPIDVIRDFSATDDIIDISALFNNIGYFGMDAEADGYLRFQPISNGSSTNIQIDASGMADGSQFTTVARLFNFSDRDSLIVGQNVIVGNKMFTM